MNYEILRQGPQGLEVDVYDLCLALGFKSMEDFKELLADFALQAVFAEAQRRAALRVTASAATRSLTPEDVLGAARFILGAETVLFYQVRKGIFEGKAVRGRDTLKTVLGCKSVDEILQNMDASGIQVDRLELMPEEK